MVLNMNTYVVPASLERERERERERQTERETERDRERKVLILFLVNTYLECGQNFATS